MEKKVAALHSLAHVRADHPQRAASDARQARPAALPLLDAILVVSRKQLISSVAGEDDLDMLGSHPRDHVRGNRRRITERFVEVIREVFNELDHVRLDEKLVMISVECAGDRSRVRELVERFLAKAD